MILNHTKPSPDNQVLFDKNTKKWELRNSLSLKKEPMRNIQEFDLKNELAFVRWDASFIRPKRRHPHNHKPYTVYRALYTVFTP